MSRSTGRRSRTLEPEDQDASRESTPISTAKNDRKRARRSPMPDEDRSTPPSAIPLRSVDGKLPKQSSLRVKPPHQPGAILRVKLTNFVTYTSAEFFPGPNLNMVIGPNGTGKSTLVCAICLGLGWGPQLLGRAKDPAEFVKHGCKEATIEIELQRASTGSHKTPSNPVITRVIKKDSNKSSFFVNGSSTANKVVLDLVKQFNIQVDNLCQFLPQDRVVEFAQMNPVQMLESTLQAAAEPSILDYHQKLKGLREKQRALMMDNKGDRETLTNLEKRQDGQRLEVERLKERQVIQKKIEWLEKCRPVPKYTEAKKKHATVKARRDTVRAELARLKRESAPILEKVQAKEDYQKAAKAHLELHKKNLERGQKECERLNREITAHENEAKDCDHHIEAEKRSVQPNKDEMARRRQLVTNLKNQKNNPPERIDNAVINQDIQERKARIRELITKGEEGHNRISEIKLQGKEKENSGKELKKRLGDLETQSGQQQTKLEIASADTHKAWKWIEENQDKFEKKVFGPPIIECSVKDPKMANAVEALLQQNDFKIITVQCHADFILLQRHLTRDQGLHDISLRTCSYEDVGHLKAPVSDDELQRYGLEQWALDCIEGPAPVLAMLCQERFLHACAVGSRNVSSEQHEAISKSAIRSYVAGNRSNRFTRRAEYGAAGSVATVREVRPARFWSDQPVDMGRKAAMERQIAEIKGEYQELAKEVKRLLREVEDIKQQKEKEEDELKKVQADKEAKQKALAEYNGLDTKIKDNEEKVQRLQNNIAAVKSRCFELQATKAAAMLARANKIVDYCQGVHTLKEFNAKWLQAEVMFIEAQSDHENLQHQNEHLTKAIEQKIKESDDVATAVRTATQEAKALICDFEKVQSEASKLEEDEGESGLSDLLRKLIANTELTERDLDDDLEAERARLELSEGGNANVVREFEERGQKIEKLRSRLTEFNQQQADLIKAIREVRAFFDNALNPIVAKINDAFSDSFARIGCAGQVALFRASSEDPADCTEEMGGVENGLDFANWAIHISVKFRESEPLSLLDSHRQSGGERAVSTIFYLMALQSLSRSPFRVVDEINQGMDPRNERMVHGRMVDIAAADENGQGQGSQYFLITPKLLSGLKYRRGMTVLCIVSGENMPAATETRSRGQRDGGNTITSHGFDFGELAKKARTLGLADIAGQRIDSGVGLGSSFGSVNRLEVGA